MSDLETKNAIRMILLTASLGGMSYLSFNNGLLLSYFSHLGIPSATILILLSILPLTTFLVIIPFSYFSDIFGKKRIGMIGMVFSFFWLCPADRCQLFTGLIKNNGSWIWNCCLWDRFSNDFGKLVCIASPYHTRKY